MSSCLKFIRAPLFVGSLLVIFPILVTAQHLTKSDRDVAESMLQNAAADVQQHYYDPKLHGVDWTAQVEEARKKIDAAQSLNGAVWEIAALLNTLQDSHTHLIPPPRTQSHDYGFQMQMIGDECYVRHVRRGSDAEKKGLQPGARILALNDNAVTRGSFWRIVYVFDLLAPQRELRVTLADGAGRTQNLNIATDIQISKNTWDSLPYINQKIRDWETAGKRLQPQFFERNDDLLVVTFPKFALSEDSVDTIITKMRAHKSVIIDLRANSGGLQRVLDRLLAGVFDRNVKVCDRIGRNISKPLLIAGRSHNAFSGKLIVLIDSESASASEVFARTVQLEKRGTVVGDRSAGMVMEAQRYAHPLFVGSRAFYAVEVTEADLVMSDGKTLEKIGVEPDLTVLPTADDLRNDRDPAMAKAAGLVGIQISPEEAAGLFRDKESGWVGGLAQY
jgi:carboxyl-terminal processing protease